jgi:glucan phosphoethanolaminetransferase (alkaline phosphatase superfamily)
MGRSIEISGNSLVYLFYASSLAIVPVLAYFVVWPLGGLTSVVVAGLLVLLVFVAVADLWYWKSGSLSEHLSTAAKRRFPYDITYTPSADPGQAAKDYWLKAVRRLPGGDGEDE